MTPSFTDIVLCEVYAFNAGLFDRSMLAHIKRALESPGDETPSICQARTVGAQPFDPHGNMTGDMNVLEVLHHFDRKYLYPEFRDLRWSSRYLLPDFHFEVDGEVRRVQVLLTLHESGVGTFLFLFTGLSAADGVALKTLVTLHRRKFRVTFHDRTISLMNALHIDPPGTTSLDGVFVRYLHLLSLDLRETNSIGDEAQDSSQNLQKSMVNRYQFMSIEGVSETYENIQAFVDQHQVALVDAAEAYSYFESPKFSYSESRTPEAMGKTFAPESSVRRHLRYQMNAYRLVAVSALSNHPDTYDYGPAHPWYSSYLGMIELVFGQFEVLYLIHGELWKNPQDHGDVLSLEETVFLSLTDYLNARVIDHPQGRKFLARLSGVLGIEDYYSVVKARLDLSHTIAVERHNERQGRQTRALAVVGFILSLVLALPVAEVAYNVFLAHSPVAEPAVVSQPAPSPAAGATGETGIVAPRAPTTPPGIASGGGTLQTRPPAPTTPSKALWVGIFWAVIGGGMWVLHRLLMRHRSNKQ